MNQTGFMHGHNVAFNLRKMIDIINITEEESIPAVIIALDFEKAFERVERCAITGTLKYFNFGENLIK